MNSFTCHFRVVTCGWSRGVAWPIVCGLCLALFSSPAGASRTQGRTQNPPVSEGLTKISLCNDISRSLTLPLDVRAHASPSTTPEWLRAYLGDVEIVEAPGRPSDPATAAVNRLRQAWVAGKRDVSEEILRGIGSQMDHRPDFVLIEAEICKSLNHTRELRACLDKPGWAAMRAARCAYLFWLSRDEADTREALASDITREAAAEPDARLFVGAQLESWGFPEVAAEIWILVAASDHPAHGYARAHLMNLAIQSGYTPLLLRLCEAIVQRQPQDSDARFTRVYLSLLLRKETPDLLNEAIALQAAKPDSPAIAAVLAYGLLRSGNKTAALKTLTGVELSALQNRPESLIGALVLENADPARARALAESSAASLKLPEEKVLFRSVLERLPKGRVN